MKFVENNYNFTSGKKQYDNIGPASSFVQIQRNEF
jgi:hypothetical protein